MDKRDRDRYNYDNNFDRYRGYDSNDDHYHRARNLTDQFEQDYQHYPGHRENRYGHYDEARSFHEGDMGGTYEQLRRQGGTVRGNTSYDILNRSQEGDHPDFGRRNRDGYNPYQQDWGGDSRHGDLRSSHDTPDRYDTYNRYTDSWASRRHVTYYRPEGYYRNDRTDNYRSDADRGPNPGSRRRDTWADSPNYLDRYD